MTTVNNFPANWRGDPTSRFSSYPTQRVNYPKTWLSTPGNISQQCAHRLAVSHLGRVQNLVTVLLYKCSKGMVPGLETGQSHTKERVKKRHNKSRIVFYSSCGGGPPKAPIYANRKYENYCGHPQYTAYSYTAGRSHLCAAMSQALQQEIRTTTEPAKYRDAYCTW